MKEKSYFDGKLLQLIGVTIVNFFITILTIGICYPFAICRKQKWIAKHTVIEGKRQQFDGRATQLIGTWIKWWLLTIITLSIYGWWIPIRKRNWIAKHTSFKLM